MRPDGSDSPAPPNPPTAPPAPASATAPTRPASPILRSIPQSSATDENLLRAYLAGDAQAFRILISRYQRELLHFLHRFIGDRATAEDLFQESFLQVHQSAAKFDLTRSFKPWLFTIAANKARDLLRSQSRRPASPLQPISESTPSATDFLATMPSLDEAPDVLLERDELRARVQAVVMGMPPHLREILLLSYFNQFPYKQVSEILGIPIGTVKSRLHAAVAFFAQSWQSSNRSPPAS